MILIIDTTTKFIDSCAQCVNISNLRRISISRVNTASLHTHVLHSHFKDSGNEGENEGTWFRYGRVSCDNFQLISGCCLALVSPEWGGGKVQLVGVIKGCSGPMRFCLLVLWLVGLQCLRQHGITLVDHHNQEQSIT